jgi:hypothetical protein
VLALVGQVLVDLVADADEVVLDACLCDGVQLAAVEYPTGRVVR